MKKLKVGDKVKLVNLMNDGMWTWEEWEQLGIVGQIISCEDGEDGMYIVRWEIGRSEHYYRTNLKLLESYKIPPPKQYGIAIFMKQLEKGTKSCV